MDEERVFVLATGKDFFFVEQTTSPSFPAVVHDSSPYLPLA